MAASSANPPFARVGIVGLGLIGASVALGARRVWPKVFIAGVDRADVVERARQRGTVDEARDSVAQLQDVDVIVLATPVPDIIVQLRNLAHDGCSTVITDVGSTKREILAAARGLAAFVGGHPMAGAARGGFEQAKAELFDGRPWLLVPGEGVSRDVTARVARLVLGLGGVPSEVDATTHDRVMAHVSHVPQLLASALMASAGGAVGSEGLALSGPAFADMTRLASSSADIWQGILGTNADFIAEALTRLVGRLPATPDAVASQAATERLFTDAHTWSRRLDDIRPQRH